MKVVSPRAAALRILATRAEVSHAPIDATYALADFQRDGAERAAAILDRRNGVIIADGVGLGKTFMAAALIERGLSAGSVAVVVPASMRQVWRRALAPLSVHPGLHLFTHGQLSRTFRPAFTPGMVVVDEAHAFRNPRTRRYRALRAWCAGSTVVLLTATPVNNSLSDLYFQLRLFAADNAFADLGIASLHALLRSREVDSRALEQLRGAVLVRRTRANIQVRYQKIELPTGERLRFPSRVELFNVSYPPMLAAASIDDMLSRIRFAAYRDEVTPVLLALSLLKRIQSSRAAALATLDRMIAFHRRFLSALSEGRLLRPRSLPSADEQLCFAEILLAEIPRGVDVKALQGNVERDTASLSSFRALLASREDAKLIALEPLLSARAPPARTIVFTEFRDTAESLWRTLRDRFRTALITGSAAWLGNERVPRNEVIRSFAPLANGARQPHPSARVDILIATDVLAEGVNLQDADAAISYDLPWNPVRLIQRAGRVDRIGSPHEVVTVYNFIPDRELDAFLGIVRRLRQKLHALRSAVGQEGAVLEPEDNRSFFADLAAGDVRLLDPEPPKAAPIPPDAAGAASPGCVAATSGHSKRVLVCFRAESHLRELIWDGMTCLADSQVADRIIRDALSVEETRDASAAIQGIGFCHDFLDTQLSIPGSDPELTALTRLIQHAVMAYGLTAPAELISVASAALDVVPSCSDPKTAHREIASARTAEELRRTLERLINRCVKRCAEPLSWELVAAIAAD
jgi:superfamily II DNA or RNA helicase